MDQQHYRLRGHPSEPGHDLGAEDYLLGRGNGRALAYVQHAVRHGDSFIVLTGEPGTGKSVLVRKLLRDLGPDNIVPALLAATRSEVETLLSAVVKAFRAPLQGHSVDELRAGLEAFLATLTASGRRALLVVDDAQHLLPASIKELAGLASLRSMRDAPLQVVLAGRPELRSSLQRAALLGAGTEPVFLFCDVGPLSADETRAYVEHRFRRARPDQPPACSADVHQRLHDAARGVPGLLDPLCDRLLAVTKERRLGRVSLALVEEATRAHGSGLTEGGAPGEGSRPQAHTAHGPDGREVARRVSAGAATRSSRARVVGFALFLVAAIVAGLIHEYMGLVDERRLSSLAVATRVATPLLSPAPAATVAQAPSATPGAVPAPDRPLPEAVPMLPVTSAAPVPSGTAVAESNGWEAVPAPTAATRPKRGPAVRVLDAATPAPGPVAGACSANLVALSLCNAVQNP